MRRRVADMVREFHTTFRLPAADTPRLPDTRLAALRVRLLLEEAREVEDAAEHRDLPGVAQELADVVYVAYGTALTYGIDLDAVIAEIHRANMSKLDTDGTPILREDGKIPKSDRYRAPDVAAVLAGQREPASPDGDAAPAVLAQARSFRLAAPSTAVDPAVHTPERVAAYLTARGWARRPKDRNLWDLGGLETVHVHTVATAPDYVKRTGLLVSDLASIYKTGELQVLADIAAASTGG